LDRLYLVWSFIRDIRVHISRFERPSQVLVDRDAFFDIREDVAREIVAVTFAGRTAPPSVVLSACLAVLDGSRLGDNLYAGLLTSQDAIQVLPQPDIDSGAAPTERTALSARPAQNDIRNCVFPGDAGRPGYPRRRDNKLTPDCRIAIEPVDSARRHVHGIATVAVALVATLAAAVLTVVLESPDGALLAGLAGATAAVCSVAFHHHSGFSPTFIRWTQYHANWPRSGPTTMRCSRGAVSGSGVSPAMADLSDQLSAKDGGTP
jgi:hypothetical protein